MMPSAAINWRSYLIEAWALGMFMISACTFVIVFEHPAFQINQLIGSGMLRRMCIGAAMGITAILLIYSKWGKQSGAHMNPAVTMANHKLNRISTMDAGGYVLAQMIGAGLAMILMKTFLKQYLSHPGVNYIVTQPGESGIAVAFVAELSMSFCMFMMVLLLSNSKFARFTGYFAGLLVFLFISVEAPLSGMSINPARSFGSAIAADNWSSIWLYMLAPVAGMQLAAILFRSLYFKVNAECKSMKCFMAGAQFTNRVYHVYTWLQKNEHGQTIRLYFPKGNQTKKAIPLKQPNR